MAAAEIPAGTSSRTVSNLTRSFFLTPCPTEPSLMCGCVDFWVQVEHDACGGHVGGVNVSSDRTNRSSEVGRPNMARLYLWSNVSALIKDVQGLARV